MAAIHQHRLDNGLWLVAEPIADVQSLAMSFQIPAGVTSEPPGRQGVAALVAEMMCRGAGELDARAHSDALDRLGVQRGTGVETRQLRLSATMLSANAAEALPLLTDMVRRPHLADGAMAPSRDLALQTLAALEDEPQQKVFLRLKGRHYAEPFGRSPLGRQADLEAMAVDDVRAFARSALVPESAVLGFAGRFDWAELKGEVERLLGDWRGGSEEVPETEAPERGYVHEPARSAQVHIGLMYDALPMADARSVLCQAATAVLSGGMSGRLFTEVREKRGLCYAVYASYAGQKDRGAVLSYAGTSEPRAQETLDVLCREHRRLSEGIEADEFERAVVGMKSRLVMQGELTAARARAIAIDQDIHGRPRSLVELAAEVDGITLDGLKRFVAEHPAGAMTIVTIGPRALNPG